MKHHRFGGELVKSMVVVFGFTGLGILRGGGFLSVVLLVAGWDWFGL